LIDFQDGRFLLNRRRIGRGLEKLHGFANNGIVLLIRGGSWWIRFFFRSCRCWRIDLFVNV
jgi:hypothetical protein